MTSQRIHGLTARTVLACAIAAPGLTTAADGIRLLNADWSSQWNTLPLALARNGMPFDIRNTTDPAVARFAALASTVSRTPGEIVPGVEMLQGDFNGDGLTDLALLNRDPYALPSWDTMPVAFANPDGTVRVGYPLLGAFATRLKDLWAQTVTGDFNGDGRTDVALVQRQPGWTAAPVLLSQPDGSYAYAEWPLGPFAAWAATVSPSGHMPKIVTGDFNGDRRTDLALVNRCGQWSTIPVAYAQPQLASFSVANWPANAFALTCSDNDINVVTGDFDGNGWSDLVRLSGDALVMARGTASGMAVSTPLTGSFPLRAQGATLLSGRFDTDATTDIALVNRSGSWTSVSVAYGNASGQFAVRDLPAQGFANWATAPGATPLAGDFDGNGLTDIALVQQAPGQDWTTIPVAYTHVDYVPLGTCSKDFCNHVPGGSWVPRLSVQNQPAPGFVDWAKNPSVRMFVGGFGR